MLISAFFRVSFTFGILMMTAITAISMALLYELYILRNLTGKRNTNIEVEDMSERQILFFMAVIVFLFVSFFNPLWFAF